MAQISPRPPEWVDEAPIQILETRTINAPASAIWKLLEDNEGWAEWFPGFRDSTFITPAPHTVGSVRSVHQDQFKVREEITQWTPNQAWGMTVIEMNVPVVAAMAENVQLIEQGATTEVRWHIGVQVSRWARPIGPILVRKSRRGLQQALAQLDGLATEAHANPE